ncbi:primosomal protein [bacterium]|jgi:Prohead core protein serine protease|nr:primosomal protein [bacterium]
MKLITELNEDVKYLYEEREGKKRLFIEGIIMQGNITNRNNRMYRIETLEREMNRYNEQYVTKNRAYGELGHPNGPTINLERAAIMFTNLRRENHNIVGKAKVLDTPMGNIVKGLIGEGAGLGISSRGMGSIKENKDGIMEVQDDFFLATAGDIVADPSAPDAFVHGIMEGVEWVWENGILKAQRMEQYKEQINDGARRKVSEETAINVFKQFLNDISKS